LIGASGLKLRSLLTNEHGHFDFGDVEPGLYFLSLALPQTTARIAVTVDRGAPSDHLDIDIGWTSCGVWFVDRSKCARSDLRIAQLSGEIVDTSGGAIPHAAILLSGSGETVVERVQADAAGRFASLHSLPGTYELTVSSPGFTSLHATVHIDPGGNSPSPSSLTVRLGVGGTCSSADLTGR
jgi:hypothetical protein